MKIKICGITNKEDALNAVNLGADAVGFIFHEASPRYISPSVVEEISLFLPPFVMSVGVFVNSDRDYIRKVSEQCRLYIIQLHGDETPATCLAMPRRVIKAIKISGPEDLEKIPQYLGTVSAILLDTKVSGMEGGSGKVFDWGLALKAKDYDVPLILAGGISHHNLNKAVHLQLPQLLQLVLGSQFHMSPSCMREVVLSEVYWQ